MLLAVDLYNRSGGERQLEAFVVHMSIGWLKLLQARFERDKDDIYVRDRRRRRQRTKEGDWLTKPLAQMVQEDFDARDARRPNIEFFIGLRNKIEHRYDRDIAALVASKSQALVLNYERTLVEQFGAQEALADRLRFPLFVSSITEDAVEALKLVRRRVPKAVLEYVQDFDAALDPEVAADQGYEFRIYLMPQTGPKSEADVAMSFVRLDDLAADAREQVEHALTIVREKQIPVANLGALLPAQVVTRVREALGLRFTLHDHHRCWEFYGVRPPGGAEHPERSKPEFCRWDDTFKRHVYTEAWVNFLVRKLRDATTHEQVLGRAPEGAE